MSVLLKDKEEDEDDEHCTKGIDTDTDGQIMRESWRLCETCFRVPVRLKLARLDLSVK